MKLARIGDCGKEIPIVIEENNAFDASAHFKDWDSEFFQSGGLLKLEENLRSKSLPQVSLEGIRYGSCVARPHKIICIGLNYSDHAAESKMEIPKEPLIFMKATNTVIGPYDSVKIPKGSEKTDWEVELGVVMGKNASYLSSPEEASEFIAGYTISHDISERSFQLERGGQWVKGKSCDTFNPLGPVLLTKDEVQKVQNLNLWLTVNGKRVQDGNTANMIFDVSFIVHYLSQFMTLEAGDLINTGTPAGVGFGLGWYLKAGDVVELGIEGFGSQRQTFIKA